MKEYNYNPNKVVITSYKWAIKKYLRVSFYKWLLKKYCQGNKTLLDVACGGGQFMDTANDLGFDAYGVDADKTHKRERVTISDIWKFKGKYDIVFNSMILEHMENPQEFMRKMVSLTNNIIITASAYLSKSFYDTPDHVKPTTKKAIKYMLHKCGFRTLFAMHIPYFQAVVVVSKKVTKDDNDKESIKVKEKFWG